MDDNNPDCWELVSQGAEARVFALELFGMPAVAKHRFSKRYRAPALDARLRKERTIQEVRCMAKSRQAGVAVPAVLMVDTARYMIYSERVLGVTAKTFIDAHRDSGAVKALATAIGEMIAKIHDAGVAHGDLTTSNFMCRQSTGDDVVDQLVLIDFGLGSLRPQPEEKAVDLYVLERALVSTHLDSQDLLDAILAAYERHSKAAAATLQRLEAVRARGRKRECFG
ncbi:hypothetical protein CTAYLR_007220 [Chrysophaeum taylorii]|uniref:non-specific serine/threonine protein kinase n=1 Tax=Chrysophaeum taylorii TaxID=2483200 RepID=A0AAD7XME7_9STRA|nr:hypothetical protein CTAYLR_007220 [Chrysophaeum taylorii]